MNGMDVFDIQSLPDVPFRRILEFLPHTAKGNMRCLSRGMEERVTREIKSKFNNLHINGVDEWNCEDIKRSLSVAMKKAHAPEKLHLQFCNVNFNSTMLEMTVDYMDNITSLGISVEDNEYLLLHPGFIFKSLESLSLNGCGCSDDTMVRVCEAMLAKHANSLRNLEIGYLKKNISDLNLPVIDSLSLQSVDEEAAWNMLEHCRPTITRLHLRLTSMISPPLNSTSPTYQFPNVKHLRILYSAFNFVEFNAEHLVSLYLRNIHDIPENFVWPQFPKLRELMISGSECLPILLNSRNTLEKLSIEFIDFDSDYPSVVMPRLTDLHLIGVNNEFTNKICSFNHRSLEILTYGNIHLPHLDDGIKMERMRNVVLRSEYSHCYTAQDWERIEICPNAEVVFSCEKNREEIRHYMRSRYKSRNFSLDLMHDWILHN